MKRSIWFLFFTIFLDLLGVGILIPIVPLLFADPSSAYFLLSPGTNIDYGYILLGFLVASYPLSLFLTAPILGQLSDRFGRKKILIISITGTALSYLLFAYGVKEEVFRSFLYLEYWTDSRGVIYLLLKLLLLILHQTKIELRTLDS